MYCSTLQNKTQEFIQIWASSRYWFSYLFLFQLFLYKFTYVGSFPFSAMLSERVFISDACLQGWMDAQVRPLWGWVCCYVAAYSNHCIEMKSTHAYTHEELRRSWWIFDSKNKVGHTSIVTVFLACSVEISLRHAEGSSGWWFSSYPKSHILGVW